MRGFPELRRHEYKTVERTYIDQINQCIAEARTNGYAIRQPERSLHYIVMTRDGPSLEKAMSSLNLKVPWVLFLNETKSTRTWMPYLPFVLTIEGQGPLWDFIRGNLFIYVLIEMDVLCQIALEKGYEAKFDPDDEFYPLHLKVPGNGMVRISKHMLMRIGLEFTSPEWIVLNSIEGLTRHFSSFSSPYVQEP